MPGYIIGVILGVITFLYLNLRPTSMGFRVSFFCFSIIYLLVIGLARLGYWNILVIPAGEVILCYFSLFFFPYGPYSASTEYKNVNGVDYYSALSANDKIGAITAPGFKQTYDRIIAGYLYGLTVSQDEYELCASLLYSKNFYPISEHTKEEIENHVAAVVDMATRHRKAAKRVNENLFNAYVCVMAIHEEATKELEKLQNNSNDIR